MPVYRPAIHSEAECEDLELWPLIYIWNVDSATGTFSLSVNGKALLTYLSLSCPAKTLRTLKYVMRR